MLIGTSVSHYAEGSLMPLLLNKIVYRIIPERAPVLLKPFLSCVFDALSHRLVAPRLRTHREYVRASRSLDYRSV